MPVSVHIDAAIELDEIVVTAIKATALIERMKYLFEFPIFPFLYLVHLLVVTTKN